MAGTTSKRNETRQVFLNSAHESVAHFKRTGIVYTLADVERYILKKAAGKKVARPKPTKVPRSRR
jgi:hypothetical protein